MTFTHPISCALSLPLLVLAACSPEGSIDAGSADSGGRDTGLNDTRGIDVPPILVDSGPDAGPEVDVYAANHVVHVELTLPSASWDALRAETRDYMETLGGDCLAAPFGSPFTWFEASMSIDGTEFERVDVRKKGFLGSLSTTRPALKIDIGEFVDGQVYGGMRRLTFNNSREDPALVRQCLGYGLFEAAGVPAPRCSFARLTVNGEDLGVYVNVEPINNALMRRLFGEDDGNLYEGTISDFRPEMVQTFDPKNNGEDIGRAELVAFSDALQVEDAALLEAIDPFIDVDEFLTFWAVESLIQHSDGFTNFRNNYYVYRDPPSQLFRFIPWGVDIILDGRGGPQSAYARSVLAYRLYQLPEIQDRYFVRLSELLEGAWDEDAINEEITRMSALIEPFLGSRRGGVLAAIEDLRSVVAGRRSVIQAELDLGRPQFSFPSPFECLTNP